MAKIGEISECGADQGIAGEIAIGDPMRCAFRHELMGQPVKYKPRCRDKAHLQEGKGGPAEEPRATVKTFH